MYVFPVYFLPHFRWYNVLGPPFRLDVRKSPTVVAELSCEPSGLCRTMTSDKPCFMEIDLIAPARSARLCRQVRQASSRSPARKMASLEAGSAPHLADAGPSSRPRFIWFRLWVNVIIQWTGTREGAATQLVKKAQPSVRVDARLRDPCVRRRNRMKLTGAK